MIQEINLGAAPNDKTGDSARVAGQKINANFAELNAKLTNKDKVLVMGTSSLVGEVLTLHAGWEWQINGLSYTNPVDVAITYPLADTGKRRLDRLVFNTSNTFTRVPGLESESNPQALPVPPDTLDFGINLITDTEVSDPSSPVMDDSYVKKIESQDFIASYGATTVIEKIDLIDDRSSILLTGAITDVKSIQMSGEFIRPGKPFFIKNGTGHDVKLWHLAGTGNVKISFSNEADLIFKNKEIIEFKLNANDSSDLKIESIGVVVVSDLSNYYTKSEVNGLVTGLWDDRGSYDASVNTYPTTGGSGASGAILKGDIWTVSVAGTLPTSQVVEMGDTVRALIDSPGNTQANWSILQNNIGYVPENTSNKSNSVSDASSTTKFPVWAILVTWVKERFFNDVPAGSSALVDADLIVYGHATDSFKTKTRTFSQFFDNLLNRFRSQISVTGTVTMQASWNGKLIIFSGSCNVTVPSSLAADYAWEGYTKTGASIAWAITSPKAWENGTPINTPANSSIAFFQEGSTNNVILLQ